LVEEQWAELEANTLIGLTDTEQLIFKQLLMKIRGVTQ
jgi:hypothetical protein